MKIALLGYGRMGKEIEKIAISRGHSIVIKKDIHTTNCDISLADIAIDFSIPSAAFDNISNCLNNNVPVISGTTGWLEKYDEAILNIRNAANYHLKNDDKYNLSESYNSLGSVYLDQNKLDSALL